MKIKKKQLKKLTKTNTKKIQKLQVKGDFNIAVSILNATLKKSVGYTNVAAFGKKETIVRDAKRRVPQIKVKENRIRRKATVRDFKPTKKYSKADIKQSLATANRLLSKIQTPLTGKHQLCLFNPNYKVKLNKFKVDAYIILNKSGFGDVITINDTSKKTQFNFWIYVGFGPESAGAQPRSPSPSWNHPGTGKCGHHWCNVGGWGGLGTACIC